MYIISSGSIISSFFNNVSAEPDPQQILLSESFRYSLLIMERNIVANIFQPKLTAYRGLPILEGKLIIILNNHCFLTLLVQVHQTADLKPGTLSFFLILKLQIWLVIKCKCIE